ncbi:MAG TPA: hypothetical protein VHU40_12705 [Polyangia bacterium]|jgi:hypothetical protein|nr:hypothetical protein [Polyangia bacterium]
MRKTLTTLALILSAGCGSEPSPTVKFRTPIGDPTAKAARSLLLGLDDVERKMWFDQMAVSGNYLYFNIPWHGVYRMPKYSGDIIPLEEANGVEDFRGIAVNATDVFWSKESSFGSVGPDFPYTRLRRQPLVGGAITTVAEGGFGIGEEFNGARMFYASPTAVYGPVTNPRQNFYDLTRFSLDGGAASPSLFRFDLGPPNPNLYTMALDEAFAYVNTCGLAPGVGCTLSRVELSTGQTDTLASPAEKATVGAVDATDLYVTADLQLLKLPKQGGGQPTLLATFASESFLGPQMLVDETDVFVVSSSNTLWAVPKAGGEPRALATGFPYGIDSLAQDERNVFVMYGYDTIDIVPKSLSTSP